MKNSRGFSSFEFYFAVSIIGIIMLFGIQRYLKLAEETRRFAFEVLAQHFNTSVYNLHAYWTLEQSRSGQAGMVVVQGMMIYFSDTGWPIAAVQTPEEKSTQDQSPQNQSPQKLHTPAVSLSSCRSLWFALLQNPAALSFEGGDAYGSRPYHLSLTANRQCRFEFLGDKPGSYYFDYSPVTGQINLHLPPITKES